MTDPLARLTAALADRYRIERELGSGGMATVYLARDLKHERGVALKVLRPELAAAVGTERFLREITTTARLTHPHILPLLDSGEAAGLPYYVMPYVAGESVRDRLRREARLPLDDALRIGREVADALSYAHGHDVVHRDIKPENILLQSGHAVVADFGIARAITAAGGDNLTQTGVSIGTPAYMSPEQSTGERAIDGRSDLYSLGCVLYEMLTGEPPFSGSAQVIFARRLTEPPPRVSVLRESVPPAVEGALETALARTAADRFPTAQAFGAALAPPWDSRTPTPRARAGRRRKAVAVIGALVVVGLGVAVGASLLASSEVDFTARDWIVVAEFDNRTGDSVFDGSLGSALAVGLQQSRHVNVLPRARIAETLRQMERPDTTLLDERTGREVALRANVRVLVAPAISRIDSTYLLTTRIVEPHSGTELLTRTRRAEGRGDVLTALDALVVQLRRDLGESGRAVARNGVGLDQATTPSLAALRAWTEGNRLWNEQGRFYDAAERYRLALSTDSDFAMAHKALGQFYHWNGQPDSGEVHFARALGLVDRVTERERLLIQASSFSARQNWDGAIQAWETYVDRYPDDTRERFMLGSAYMRALRHADAVRTLREVVAADSMNASAYVNLATTYGNMGQPADALPHYLRAFRLQPQWLVRDQTNLNHEFGFNYVRLGMPDSAVATFNLLLGGAERQRAQGHRSLGLLRMYQGKYAEARTHLEEAIALNRVVGASLSEFRNRLYLATTYANTGAEHQLRTELAEARTLAERMGFGAGWLVRLAGFYARLGDTIALGQLAQVMRERANPDDQWDQAAVTHADGLVALTGGRYDPAVEILDQAVRRAPDDGLEYRPALATAYRLNGDPARAVTTLLQVVASPQALGWEPQESWVQAHYQLGQLYEDRGDTAQAVAQYDRFLEIWKDGDPDLVALADARKRRRALTSRG